MKATRSSLPRTIIYLPPSYYSPVPPYTGIGRRRRTQTPLLSPDRVVARPSLLQSTTTRALPSRFVLSTLYCRRHGLPLNLHQDSFQAADGHASLLLSRFLLRLHTLPATFLQLTLQPFPLLPLLFRLQDRSSATSHGDPRRDAGKGARAGTSKARW
jgi:hypothetical protein